MVSCLFNCVPVSVNFEHGKVVGLYVCLRVGLWEVFYVNAEEQGRQNRSLWDAIVDAFQSALLTIADLRRALK